MRKLPRSSKAQRLNLLDEKRRSRKEGMEMSTRQKNDKTKGVSRRQFLTGSMAAFAGTLLAKDLFAQDKDLSSTKKSDVRLILLGTGGGPRPNKMRNQSAWVVIVNNIPYVVDCGGVSADSWSLRVSPLGLSKTFSSPITIPTIISNMET